MTARPLEPLHDDPLSAEEREVAARKMGVDGGGSSARARRKQHHADADRRRQIGKVYEPEAQDRQDDHLAAKANHDRPRPGKNPCEIRYAQRQAEPKHDDDEGDWQTDAKRQTRLHDPSPNGQDCILPKINL